MNRVIPKVALGICAHPDDLDFGASGTVAKWSSEGSIVYYLIVTDGSKGSSDPKMTPERLIKIRKSEQVKAAEILGVKETYFLNYKDSEVTYDMELKKDLTRYIRKLQPDAVIMIDPTMIYSVSRGFINHPDHRVVGLAALDSVFPLARDRLTFPDLLNEGLEPHRVRYLYLINFDYHNYVEDIGQTIEKKLQAVRAHQSQVEEDFIQFLKQMSATLGRKVGYSFAETFVKIDLP
jgi:LmbE family N-acetylglucosaminyl deacetylase